MTDTGAARLRDDYLGRLDAAMRDVPHGIASDIRAGILEEFSGLDADAAAALIARLGDPETIAREAGAGAADAAAPVMSVSPAVAAAAGEVPASRQIEVIQTRGFALLAALVLGFGGIVVPVVGWFVGAVLVCLSRLWRTWEKTVAIAAPVVAVVGVWIVVSLAPASEAIAFNDGGTFQAPAAENPLLPAGYDIAWSTSFIILLVVIPASGLWLLWRLRGRHPVS